MANVRWARKLEDAGVHVVYGVVGLKTHAKLSMVVRQEGGIIRRYVHMGTGNYHPKTARLYEDFGLLSADALLGDDVNKLFNSLSGFAPQAHFACLLVAPRGLRKGLLEKIENEIADIFLYLVRFSDLAKIDLEKSALRKIALNAKKYPIEKSKGSDRKYTELGK